MEVTVEQINGKPMTVIRKPFDAEWVREQLAVGIPIIVEDDGHDNMGENCRVVIKPRDNHLSYPMFRNNYEYIEYIITILPPLPRHPTQEDASLLYLYASEGLFAAFGVYQFAHIDDDGEFYVYGNAGLDMISSPETTHCVDQEGNRVEVAIKGE